MSLYTAPSGGDFLPYVKYNGKAGRWYIKKDGAETEVQNPTFIADFAGVKKIWAHYSEGLAPDVIEFPSIDAQVAKPSENHKMGLKLNLYSQDMFGGLVEFSSTAAVACSPISALYEKYLAEAKEGELPVVKVTGATPISGKHGTNYEPVFEVVKYVPRPADMDRVEDPAPAPQAAPAPVAAASGSEF